MALTAPLPRPAYLPRGERARPGRRRAGGGGLG
jgi:hypothetical protein